MNMSVDELINYSTFSWTMVGKFSKLVILPEVGGFDGSADIMAVAGARALSEEGYVNI